MRIRIRLCDGAGLALAALLLAGCETPPPAEIDATLPPGADCPAAQYRAVIGQPLVSVTFDWPAHKIRTTAEGQPVTLDYWPDRLNVSYDAAGRISGLSCG